jgi:hypothetical protein
MKNLIPIFACLLLLITETFFAQDLPNNAEKWTRLLLNQRSPTISIGFNGILPAASTVNNLPIAISTSLNADLYFPFLEYKKGWNGRFTLGINAGGSYNLGSGTNATTALPTAFNISGQTASSVAFSGNTERNQVGFKAGGGPQANFYIGNFVISPMLLFEYFSMTNNAFSALQTTQFNGESFDFIITETPENKTTAFAITPRLRMQYVLTNGIGIFLEGGYTAGPIIETQTTNFVPEGNPEAPDNLYNLKQVQNGIQQKGESIKSGYTAFSFGAVFHSALVVQLENVQVNQALNLQGQTSIDPEAISNSSLMANP